MKILLITEQREGKWNNVSFETLAAAQQIASQTSGTISCVVVGKGVSALADALAAFQLDEVLLVEHDLLEKYTPDGFSIALRQVIENAKPGLVLLPHTYQVRDFAPKLAASLSKDSPGEGGKGLIGDCIGYRHENGRLIFVRQMFQGRTNADVIFTGEPPWIATFQAGAFRADLAAKGASKAPIKTIPVELKPEQIRTKPLELFREAKQAVDLTQAPILVSVGRGIKAPENIPIAEKLAKLLGGEVSASRPICDEGWLPMDRQIGSSGQTVAPKLYFALGISGAIQHVVGMKGSRTIAAINKDQNAPIFEIADYGVVGDLFEIVPALIEELEKSH
ncbi:MAG TPA: electron transfer flavoprotein subunit alpha/FixB family protein [Candidatus Acidoferrales bacterium]|nr:electron transfer flavoprotein subunit alpha/FixB family protein [Candidatus Acidoferrales bacterium]